MNIEYFMNQIEINRRMKRLERILFWKRVDFFVVIFILIFLLLFLSDWYAYNRYPTIDYSKLNQSQTIYAENLIKQIRPEYLNMSSRITFTTNLDDISLGLDSDGGYLVGINRLYQKSIIIYLSGDEEEDLRVIQHELLHSIVLTSEDEFFVDDMARQDIALKIRRITLIWE